MPAPEYAKQISKVGVRVKAARLTAGMTQWQLAGDEYTRGFISQIENGVIDPSLASLIYIAARLGKPVTWFLEDTPLPEIPPPTPKLPKWHEAMLSPVERRLITLYRQGNKADRGLILATARWVVANCDDPVLSEIMTP